MNQTIPTDKGNLTIQEILDFLMWDSYRSNREEGLSHETLVKFGIGNDGMKEKYESLKN